MLPLLLALLLLQDDADVTATFDVPAGLEVRRWAESPMLFNPTAIDVDARGRLWVTEAVNYRQWNGRNPGRHHDEGDRVMILEDTDRDGIADSSKVFVQDPDLTSPLGIAVIGKHVYVSCSPNLFRYVDEDGDDVPDRRETFLTGFGGFDHDHGLHSVVCGPDGWLYFAAGNAGPHIVTDQGGWTLRSGSLYNGGGPQVADNKPGLLSDDGKAWTGGLILRCRQDGTGLEVLAHNFRNNYEVALDSYGNLYQSDNDDDGNRGCRTLWCMEGGDHGYFSSDGTRYWRADRRPGQSTETAHWHQDDPGVVPAGCINGAGGPTGVCVYEGEMMAPWIDGCVLNADAGANVVYAHKPVPNGAGIDLEPGELIRAKPLEDRDAKWFRPSDVCVGTDGSVFVADWYDPGVGGHMAGDREAYGRILRIAPKALQSPGSTHTFSEINGQLLAFDSPAVHVRELARQAMLRADAEHTGASGPVESSFLFAINGWHYTFGGSRLVARHGQMVASQSRASMLEQLAGDIEEDPRWESIGENSSRFIVGGAQAVSWIRSLATTTGRITPEEIRSTGLHKSKVSAVRRETLFNLRGVPLDECLDLLLDLAEAHDGNDRYYVEAFGLAAEGREEELYAELAAELGDVPLRWDARFEDLAWRLHPNSAAAAFTARALAPELPERARRRAIDALAFMTSREAAEAVLTIAQTGPEDLRSYALWWVGHRDTNDWREFALLDSIGGVDFEGAELVYESDLVRREPVMIDADITGAEALWLVVTDGGNGNSCDWAAWIEPTLHGPAGELDLLTIDWLEAEAQWGSVNVGKNCVGAKLAIGSNEYERGIGAHAKSTIAYSIPQGYDRFTCLAGPERGGTSQGNGQATSIRFQVWAKRPDGPGPEAELQARALDSALALDERLAAADELARSPKGALRLLSLAEHDTLPQELAGGIADAIYQNPDPAVRALASAHFPHPGGYADWPSVAELVALKGDATNGRRLFFEERAQCGTCHVVQRGDAWKGGDVGPDLTHVARKLAPEALIDAILNPSAGIAFGYDTWMIETADGEVLSGFLLADGENVVLKDTQELRHVIPAGDVVFRKKQTLSVMPEGVALGLEPQELCDIVAFLTEAPTEPEFGPPIDLFDGRSLNGWTHHLSDPDVPAEDVWSIENGELVCKGQPIGYLRTTERYTNYRLTLEWRFDPELGPGNSGVLLRMVGDDKVWPKSIEAQLHHRNAGDIWNIDEFPMIVDPARTSGRRTTRREPSNEKPLGEWNHYEITVLGPRLELRVNGALQNTADWCDEVPGFIALQSEGAAIRFRNVRLEPVVPQ